MTMKFNIKHRIANLLAVLSTIIIMNLPTHTAQAGEHLISLPDDSSAPITLRVPYGAVKAENKNINEKLQIFVGNIDGCCDERTPIAGRYVLESNSLTFKPAFNFVEGQEYVARIQTSGENVELVPFEIGSAAPMEDVHITTIYPSADVIPENTLRFYIHFSAPMQPHVSFEHIKLVSADGKVDEAAFMKFKQELWNEDRTRLTVLMDPGRIKRNVATNRELGPALHKGTDYSLIVTDGWMPVQGKTALKKYSKIFSVGQALRELPNTDEWKMSLPRSNTQESLIIEFDRSFDAGLLQKSITVMTAFGQVINGVATISNNETVWSFKPDGKWSSNSFNIVVDPHLEDVAGNNFKDLLDHQAKTEQIKTNEIVIPIELPLLD